MISDQQRLAEIREAWSTVRILQARIQTTLNAGLFSLVPAATGFREVPDSLLLLFAFSVFEDALLQLRDEGVFRARGNRVSDLMDGSQAALPWQDYAAVNAARERRNDVAHRRAFLRDSEIEACLMAIERELVAWRVLEHPVQGRYAISFHREHEGVSDS